MSHKLSGQVDGTFSYHGGGPDKRKGEASLKAIDAAIALQPPLFDLHLIRFHSLEADLTVSGAKLAIARCDLKGSDLDARFSGTILLKNPIGTSDIKVSGTLRPHPVFLSKVGQVLPLQLLSNQRTGKNGIPIRFYNTLEMPRFSFR
jgi:type II secretion system protein N